MRIHLNSKKLQLLVRAKHVNVPHVNTLYAAPTITLFQLNMVMYSNVTVFIMVYSTWGPDLFI